MQYIEKPWDGFGGQTIRENKNWNQASHLGIEYKKVEKEVYSKR